MTATRQDVEGWVIQAKEQGYMFLIVACDRFDYDNYPIYCNSGMDCDFQLSRIRCSEMHTVDEVYDMSMDIDAQLKERRAYHPPGG